MTTPELRHADLTAPELIEVWHDCCMSFLAAVEAGGAAGWSAPTPCPGWSVGDLVAHLSFIERFLLQRWDPPHEPDWATLAHVKDDFGRVTEIPVDLRRTWPRADVLAEFRTTIADRLAALRAGPQELDAMVMSPFGAKWPLDKVLRTRVLDIWIHEQDVRTALNNDGDWGTAGAWVTASRFVAAIPVVWAKGVDAPLGSSLRVEVTGPGVMFTGTWQRGADGRVSPAESENPDAVLTTPWPELVRLMGGRDPRGEARIEADAALGERLLESLAVTP